MSDGATCEIISSHFLVAHSTFSVISQC